MQLDLDRTIVAVSSPLASAYRAVVRISGSQTLQILEAVLCEFCSGPMNSATDAHSRSLSQFFVSRQPTYRRARFDLDWHGRSIDVGVYYWPNERSFTGEPSAEIHVLGSQPIVNRIVNRLSRYGANPAERGEFALRSFLAGKIDLVQAEALLGVIQSVQEQQLQWALKQLGGDLSQQVGCLRNEVVELLAHLEAGLDFAEEDIQFITEVELQQRIDGLSARVAALSRQLDSRGGSDRQLEIVLVGLPNAGKSSLLNALLGKNRTIVTAQAGTTRDAVAAPLSLDGVSVTLVDTAGIELVDEDTPRAEAQSALRRRIEVADIVLLCIDAGQSSSAQWQEEQRLRLTADGRSLLIVATKADLLAGKKPNFPFDVLVSIHSAESLQQLRSQLLSLVQSRSNPRFTQATHHTAVRCRTALELADGSLQRAAELLNSSMGEELVASELHCVLDELSSIIGQVHSDDILGEIFSRFCIGK